MKSGLVKNPVSDRATALWKTFTNWSDAVANGILKLDTTAFEIYLGRRHSGQIADAFSAANTTEAATDALRLAREKLLGDDSRYERQDNVSEDALGFIGRFLDPANPNSLGIVKNFTLTSASSKPLDDLRAMVADKWVRPEIVEDVITHAHGWVKERVDALIQDRLPAVIAVDDFRAEMLRIIPRLDFQRILVGFAGKPSDDEIAEERVRTYVRQMELIEASDEDVIAAINDYLRASVMRSKWGEQGIVHEKSFDDFFAALSSYWRNKRRSNSIVHHGLTPVEQGQLLLSDCAMQRQTLQGLEVPTEFTPGSYHAMSDDLKIGWHPDYESRFKYKPHR